MTRLIATGMILFFSVIPAAWSQQRVTGTVTGGPDKEILAGASVYIIPGGRGTITNVQGRYRLTINPESRRIVASFVGYRSDTVVIARPLAENADISFNLDVDPVSIPAARIVGQQGITKISNPEPGLVKIPASEIARIPSLMGERDPISLIRNLPGVQSVGEGDGYLYVRGGNADQNLVMLDGAVLYNPAHLLGLFSVINPSVVKSIDFYKGAIPASYTGRLSSVVDISMRSGNDSVFGGEVSTGIIASRFMIEGPISKGKASFLVAGRRTHLDLLTLALVGKNSPFKGSAYYFADFNGRIDWKITDRQVLSFSGYAGTDDFKLKDTDFTLDGALAWSNRFISLKHVWQISKAASLNSRIILSNYDFNLEYLQGRYELAVNTGVKSLTCLSSMDIDLSKKNKISFGAEGTWYGFIPYRAQADFYSTDKLLGDFQVLHADQYDAFIQDTWDVSPRLNIQAGLRFSLFRHMGPFDRYITGITGIHTDTVHFASGRPVGSFFNADPRISISYKLREDLQVRSTISWLSQPLHMVPVSASTLPVDIWLPSTLLTPPQHAVSGSLGFYFEDESSVVDGYAEGFYRYLYNQTEFRENLSSLDLIKRNMDQQLTIGTGTAWGAEFMLRKPAGVLKGWIAYTFSVTKRVFPEINHGIPFYARHDRRHDLNISLSWPMGLNWSGSMTFIFATGQAVSMPLSLYYVNEGIVTEYGERNSYRMPPYHRMDLGLTKNKPKKGRFISTWGFSIYNLYNRLNPFFIYYDTFLDTENATFTTKSRKVSLLPIVPSISWTGSW
jgi:outer membrane receptor protein involved in Fe transport